MTPQANRHILIVAASIRGEHRGGEHAHEACFSTPSLSTAVQVGGIAQGEGNAIAYSGTNAVADTVAASWAILGNSMYGNGFGISLAGSDNVSPPTQNDLDDPDTGPNNRQNYSVLAPGIVKTRSERVIGKCFRRRHADPGYATAETRCDRLCWRERVFAEPSASV